MPAFSARAACTASMNTSIRFSGRSPDTHRAAKVSPSNSGEGDTSATSASKTPLGTTRDVPVAECLERLDLTVAHGDDRVHAPGCDPGERLLVRTRGHEPAVHPDRRVLVQYVHGLCTAGNRGTDELSTDVATDHRVRLSRCAGKRTPPARYVGAAAHPDGGDGYSTRPQLAVQRPLARKAQDACLDAALAQRRHQGRPVPLGAAHAHVRTYEEEPHG